MFGRRKKVRTPLPCRYGKLARGGKLRKELPRGVWVFRKRKDRGCDDAILRREIAGEDSTRNCSTPN